MWAEYEELWIRGQGGGPAVIQCGVRYGCGMAWLTAGD